MTIKTFTTAIALVAVGTSTAFAGSLDRGILPISPLFEKTTYVEVATALVLPSVDGTFTPTGAQITNIYENYTQSSLSFKTDLVPDKLALSVSYFQPIGTDISYAVNPLLDSLSGATANLQAHAFSAILKYKFNNFSVYGGAKYESIIANLLLGGAPFAFARDNDIVPILGVAYERPEIALRVSLTYIDATEYSLATTVSGAPVPSSTVGAPESWTLDFQTGIAKDTLVFGAIRHSKWVDSDVIVPAIAPPIGPNLSNFENITSFDLGIARKLTDNFSAFTSLNFEREIDGITGNLAPIDGRKAITIGGLYKAGKAKITGGIRYTSLGDATTTTFGNKFTNNHSISIGMKVGYSF